MRLMFRYYILYAIYFRVKLQARENPLLGHVWWIPSYCNSGTHQGGLGQPLWLHWIFDDASASTGASLYGSTGKVSEQYLNIFGNVLRN